MKRILLLLILFCALTGIALAQPETEPETVQVDSLIDFGVGIDLLKTLIATFLGRYYGLLIGVFLAFLIFNYIKGVSEGRKMRQKRKLQECKLIEKQNQRAQENQLLRERALIRKYSFGDDDTVSRIQLEMYSERVRDEKEDLQLAPIEDDVIDNHIDRGGTYWHSDGSEEGSTRSDEETVGFGNSSTVDLRRKYCNCSHRETDDDEGGGY